MELAKNNIRKITYTELTESQRCIQYYVSKKEFSPHLVCLSEHNVKDDKVIKFSLSGCNLAAMFCQNCFTRGDCILVRKDI